MLPRDLNTSAVLFRRDGHSVRMGALLQVQGAFYVGESAARQFDDPADTEGFRIRRARVGFSGALFHDFSYYIAIDLKDAIGAASGGDPGSEVLDARIRWRRFSWLNVSDELRV